MVAQQVSRMDDIVGHQLGRAGASGAARFAPPLALAPILNRIRDTLAKVYAEKSLAFTLDCAPELRWRIDQGDAFEMLGNVLDNAAKWARHAVSVRIWRDSDRLCIRVTDDGPGFGDPQATRSLTLSCPRLDAGPLAKQFHRLFIYLKHSPYRMLLHEPGISRRSSRHSSPYRSHQTCI
jgi:light-regulated signal transduction histidine kinase (bacteriophytochrome)